MRRVILESPYAGNVEANVRYARRCVRDALGRGEAPIASHLLYTQEGVLNDDLPTERAWGINAGLAWGEVAEATVVYLDLGISQGMIYGIQNAMKAGRPIEYRYIDATLVPRSGALITQPMSATEKYRAMMRDQEMQDKFKEAERAKMEMMEERAKAEEHSPGWSEKTIDLSLGAYPRY